MKSNYVGIQRFMAIFLDTCKKREAASNGWSIGNETKYNLAAQREKIITNRSRLVIIQ